MLSNDTDQNSCDILQIQLYKPPSFGAVVLNSDGSFDYSHDDSENFEDKFKYLLNDGECDTWDTVTVTIRIDPVPDTPLLLYQTVLLVSTRGLFRWFT